MTGKTKKAGVMGWPVSHSLSPRLHGYWLRLHGIDGTYEALPVEPKNFESEFRALSSRGFVGVNVTVPHKEAALANVDRVEPLAARIGAVNTVVIDTDGRMEGRNTDAYGFVANLDAGAPGWDATRGKAVVLGAGGAARAVIVALLDRGFSIRLANRTRDRARALAAALGGKIDVVAWDDRSRALEGAELLVNTTTLGMTGKPPLEIALDPLPTTAVVTDIVYAPLQTTLLKAATSRGHRTVDGLGMLLHQARPGFAAWFGTDPAVTADLRAHVLGG